MSKDSVKNICIVVQSLGGGGLERMAALQSIYLDSLGYTVFIATVNLTVSYDYKGTLVNLGEVKDKENTKLNKLKRFRILKRFLKANQIDCIIDHRVRRRWWTEALIAMFLYNKAKTIYTIHSYNLDNYIPRNNSLFRYLFSKFKCIVTVSKTIEATVNSKYSLQNTQTIYNGFNIKAIEDLAKDEVHIDGEYIVWFGRLDDASKNFRLLLEGYKNSKLPEHNVKLKLIGKGPDESMIKVVIDELDLNNEVELCGYKANPYALVAKSKFKVLSSRYEGFPMVLPEALACGVPVVSVDCKSGPSEIITHNHNGLLVEQNNVTALSEALNTFIEDEALYLKCKQNAKASVKHLDIEYISKQWQTLIHH